MNVASRGRVLLVVFAVACGDSGTEVDAGGLDGGAVDAASMPEDGGAVFDGAVSDGAVFDGAVSDGAVLDGGMPDGAMLDGGSPVDAGRTDGSTPCTPMVAPTAALRPTAGELFYVQLGLGGVSIGESALVVGPDGTTVLIDVGNDSHDDDVEDAVDEWTPGSSVDHVVVTHFHADHGDAIEQLLERIDVTGSIVHRGFTDLNDAANASTVERLCDALAVGAAADGALCTSASLPTCAPSTWSGTYPATACAGLASADIALGAGAMMDFIGANGVMDGHDYAIEVGPLDSDDSNGENARSVVALLSHGAFSMLVAGDLTGGGSDTDDVESFYAPRLGAVGVSALGVDVLHASHHGRNTSTNTTWANRLLPVDGRSRNAIMGVSTLHIGSPHDEVLSVLLDGGRLAEGRAWTTRITATGSDASGLVDADGGHIVLSTLDGGNAYAIQAVTDDGTVLESRAFRSLDACP